MKRRRFSTEEERRAAEVEKQRRYRSKITSDQKRAFGRRATDAYMRKVYGISLDTKEQMVSDQQECEICFVALAPPVRAHVDHCHKTGIIRAILCSQCNSGLGMFKDDPERMRRAASYIEVWAEVHSAIAGAA